MKNQKKRKLCTIAAVTCAFIIPIALLSCNSSHDGQSSQNNLTATDKSESANKSKAEQKIELDSYEEQIAYYISLSKSLQDELLILKEEKYIEDCENEIKIDELERTISLLKDTISDLNDSLFYESEDLPSDDLDKVVMKNDYIYEVNNGEVTITEYIGKDIDVTVPSEINGFSVTNIGDSAFCGKTIHSITIPSSIKKIGWFAFEGCTALESITIPSSVTSIGYGAFNQCSSFMTITCKNGSYIEKYANSWGIKTVSE